jgi:hypothetical protein
LLDGMTLKQVIERLGFKNSFHDASDHYTDGTGCDKLLKDGTENLTRLPQN